MSNRKERQRAKRRLKRQRQKLYDKAHKGIAVVASDVQELVAATIRDCSTDRHKHRNGQYVDKGYLPARPGSNRVLFRESDNHAIQRFRRWVNRGVIRGEALAESISFKQVDCVSVGGKVRSENTVVVRVNNGSTWELKPNVSKPRVKKSVVVEREIEPSVEINAVDMSKALREDREQRAMLARKSQRNAAHDQRLGSSC